MTDPPPLLSPVMHKIHVSAVVGVHALSEALTEANRLLALY